jgi:hypothetical protein
MSAVQAVAAGLRDKRIGAAHDELELDGTCVPVAGALMGARRHAGGYAGNSRRRW